MRLLRYSLCYRRYLRSSQQHGFVLKFSSNDSSNDSNSKSKPGNKQDFVKVEFEPGEWDQERKDPLHRPPWKGKARQISIDELNNMPRISLEGYDRIYKDPLYIPSFLYEEQREQIYNMYLEMMEELQNNDRGATSHEYVCYVISQKMNIAKERVAAVIQLRHNEEKIRKEGGPIFEETAAFMDKKMKEVIDETFQDYKQPVPKTFIEDPALTPRERSREVVTVDDSFDVDEAERELLARDKSDAQLYLNNKFFIEDKEDGDFSCKINLNCKSLVEKREEYVQEKQYLQQQQQQEQKPIPKRKQYKFMAKIIESEEMTNRKTKNKLSCSKLRKSENILVEHNNTLRAATIGEVNRTSWKSKKNTLEFIYKDAKQAWLQKALHKKDGAWGKA